MSEPVAGGTSGEGRTALRGTLVAAVATLGSRVLGFVRDAFMAGFLGVGPELASFHLAWVLPNLFRRLFGEGAVSAAVVPALSRIREERGQEAAVDLFARFQGVFFIGLIVLVLVGEAVVWIFRGQTTDLDDRNFLLLAAILLPYLLPICMAALAGAPQHLTGRFSLPALAPAMLNLVWISALLIAWAALGFEDQMPALILLSGGILLGGLLQWWMQWPALRASGYKLLPRFRHGDGTVRTTLRSFAPALIGLAVVQLNLAIDQALVRGIVGKDANTYTHLANRLLQLPLALIGISAATAMLPMFSRLAAQGRLEELRSSLRRGSEMTLLVILAAGIGLYVTAVPVITTLFEHGRFTSADTLELSAALRSYLWCLPAAVLAGIFTRARQARGDYRGPAWIAASVVPVNLVLDLILLPELGVPGAGYATSVSITMQAVLLGAGMRSLELGSPLDWGRLPRIALPGLAAGGAAWGALALLGESGASIIGLVVSVGAGVVGATVATAVFLPGDFAELKRLIKRKVAS